MRHRDRAGAKHVVPAFVFAALAGAFCMLWLEVGRHHKSELKTETRSRVEAGAIAFRSAADVIQESAHQAIRSWAEGGSTFAGFDEAAEELIARHPEILAANWLNPDGQVTHVYPGTMTSELTGRDLRVNARERAALEHARATEVAGFSPPVRLASGVVTVGCIMRLNESSSDGFIQLLVRLETLTSGLDLDSDRFAFHVACTGEAEEWFDTSGANAPVSDLGEFGSSRELVLAPNSWTLRLVPLSSYVSDRTTGSRNFFLAASLVLSLVLSWIVRRELLSREALADSEHRYRSVVQDLPDFICRYSSDGTITFVNEAFAARFGRHSDDLIGTSLFELYPEEEWEDLRIHIARLTPGVPVESYRYHAPDNDRPRVWERWHERALGDGESGPIEVQSIGFDVTEARNAEERLRHSQERYRTLIEASPDGVVILRGGCVVYANQSFANLIGSEGTWQLAGQPLMDLLPARDRDRFHARMEEVMERGEQVRVDDERIKHLQGHMIDVEVIATRVVFDEQPALQAIMRDVTERRQAERALRDSEERFRTIFSSITDGVLIHDRNGALKEVNDSACKLFGQPREVLCQLDVGALVADGSPKTIEELRKKFADARGSDDPQRFEFEARRGRDELWWAEVNLRAATVGGRERLLSVVRDVTDRRESQDALRAARNRLDHLLSTGPTIIYSRTPGPQHRLTFVSRNAQALIGLSPDHLLQDRERWRNCVHEADRLRVDAELAEADARGDRFTCEYRILDGNGEEIWIQDDARLLRDSSGAPVEWVGSWRDISTRKNIEQSQRLLMSELDHRVKNTLAMVVSLLDQTLAATLSREELRDAFRGRIEALARAHEALARGRWEAVDLERIAGLVLGPHVELGRIGVAGPTYQLDARTASPLALALHELGTNAIKYGALSVQEGHVLLTWAEEDRGLVVTWKEREGPPTTAPTSGGTGLRLIRGLIEHELGGRVVIEFQEGGLVAEVILPLADTAPRPQLLV